MSRMSQQKRKLSPPAASQPERRRSRALDYLPATTLNLLIGVLRDIGRTGKRVKSSELFKELERDGWVLDRVRGSHHIFTHPTKPGHLSVPRSRKDLGKGLLAKLRKQAGLR